MRSISVSLRLLASAILAVAAFVAGFSTTMAKSARTEREGAAISSREPGTSGMVPVVAAADSDFGWREAVQRMGEHPGSEAGYDDLLKMLLQWEAVDPRAAVEYVAKHFDVRHRNAFLSALLAKWAAQDGEAAVEWVTKNLPHDYTQYDAVLSAMGRMDAQSAWRAAQKLAGQEDNTTAQAIYVSALRGIIYNGNYAQAAGMIANLQLPAGGEKYDLSSLLAGQWGLYEPSNAAQWAVALTGNDSLYGRQALASVGVAWSQSDPEGVANFAMQLPAGVTKQNVLTTALDSWAANNPGEAANWINQYPPDPDLDFVVRSLATSPQLVDGDPTLALTWADSIFDGAIKRQAMNIIMDRWMANDPAAANAFVNNLAVGAGNNMGAGQ